MRPRLARTLADSALRTAARQRDAMTSRVMPDPADTPEPDAHASPVPDAPDPR